MRTVQSNEVLIYSPNREQPGETPYETGPVIPQRRSKAGAIQLANLVFLLRRLE